MQYNKTSIQKKRAQLHSKKKRVRSSISVILIKVFLLLILVISVAGVGFLYGSFQGILETVPTASSLEPSYSATIVYDDNGEQVQVLSDYSSNRILIESEDIPSNLKYAFIAIEDERFYEHNGVDLKGIIRAGITAILNGGATEGASTITQQLIKNVMFNVGGETNFIAKVKRKIQEQYLAIDAEKKYSKEEILTNYLNTINLGKGTLGVEAAAKYYFGKSASELSLSECAVLASITKNPSKLNPVDYPEENRERQVIILKKMYELNYISSEEYNEALNDDVYSRISQNQTTQSQQEVYSYFTDALITQIVEDLEEQYGYTQSQAYELVYRGGLRIYSTQSTELQSIADSIINDESNYPVDTKYSLEYDLTIIHEDKTTTSYTETDVRDYFREKTGDSDYDTIYSSKKKLKKAVKKFKKAIVNDTDTIEKEELRYALEPQLSYSLIDQSTGEVKVLVGGRGEKQDNLALNRATAVTRQPGSTFKILSTYAPALDTGGMTLATVFDDAPYEYENGDTVTNSNPDEYSGLTTIRDAIIHSNNIVAVKALTEITPQVGYDYLLKLGFTTLVSDRTSSDGSVESDVTQALSLGGITDGVTNLELTAAYASIANKGTYNTPILYTTVTDNDGNVLLENKTESQQVMKETTAWLLTNAMEDVVEEGTGVEAQLSSDMGVAGKTGTTSNNYDYWFCGYTPYYTASIWTGYDYNTSFKNEDDYHKVIWAKIMDQIIETENQEIKDFDDCENITQVNICKKSGKLPVENVCSNDPEESMVTTEYFEKGTEPTESCGNHIAVTLCKKTNMVARKYCTDTYTKVFRIRPEGSSGETDDTPYCMTFTLKDYKCTYHTKKWKENQEKKKQEQSTASKNNESDGDSSSSNGQVDVEINLQSIKETLQELFP